MVDLSISIVNTSNWHYLEPCIRSIIENTAGITYEILVVDNASTDGSVDRIRHCFPQVVLTANDTRHGFAANNNINLRRSTGRYLMLLNDDTLVLPHSLEDAVRYLDGNVDVGMVGCKMIWPDGTVQFASGRRLPTLLTMFFRELGLSYRYDRNPILAAHTIGDWNHDSLREIELPSEAGLIIRKSVVDAVGLLDESFFMYGEGADWARQTRAAGYRIVFLPHCPIVHFGNVTNRRSGSTKREEQYYKSMYLYFQKGNAFAGLAYQIMVISVHSAKYALASLTGKLAPNSQRPDSASADGYRAVVGLMVSRLRDPDYPFPTRGLPPAGPVHQ